MGSIGQPYSLPLELRDTKTNMSASKLTLAAKVGIILLGAGHALLAQVPSDSACRVRLNAASSDSETMQLTVQVTGASSPEKITPHFASMVAQGIVQTMRVPRPLPLNVYQAMNKGAWQTLKGTYLVTLHRDGHLTHPRTVGGTGAMTFNAAVIAAIAALDTSGLLPPPDSALLGADSIELRVAIERDKSYSPTRPAPLADGSPVPLMRIRVPIREGNGGPYPKPGNRAPRYPTAMRETKTSGSVRIQFVVKADSTIDMTSIQVVHATADLFLRAVLDALPEMRFFPLTVEQYPVAGFAEMPFTFSM